LSEMTAINLRKVTRYREDGEEALEREIERQHDIMRQKEAEQNTDEMEWEHVANAPGKVKWVNKNREAHERSDWVKPKWTKKRV